MATPTVQAAQAIVPPVNRNRRRSAEAARRAGMATTAAAGLSGPCLNLPAQGISDGTDEPRRLSNERLVECYQRTGCSRCLDALLDRNTKLLHHVLKRFTHVREPYEDLLQVARLALLKAAQRFDPSLKYSFSTYAVALVDGELRHYLRDNALMRLPRWAQTAYKKIETAQADFYREHHRFPSLAELADLVNIEAEGVLAVIRAYSQSELTVIDDPDGASGEPIALDGAVIRSLRPESFTLPIEDRIAVYEALAALSAAQKKLIYLLFFRDLTQQEVAEEMGMTQRTVSREQHRALAKLKAILTKKLF